MRQIANNSGISYNRHLPKQGRGNHNLLDIIKLSRLLGILLRQRRALKGFGFMRR